MYNMSPHRKIIYIKRVTLQYETTQLIINEQISFLYLPKPEIFWVLEFYCPHLPLKTDLVWYDEVVNKSHVPIINEH